MKDLAYCMFERVLIFAITVVVDSVVLLRRLWRKLR